LKKRKVFTSFNGDSVHVIDLPGTYSLTAYSMEEVVVRDYLTNNQPDLLIDVVDASNLERNLYLALQFRNWACPWLLL
jgi:ferrous iron transport protein B